MEMDEDVAISRENGIAENEEKPVENILANKPIEEVLSQENTKNGILQNGNSDLYSLEGTSDVLDVDFDMTADSEDSWYVNDNDICCPLKCLKIFLLYIFFSGKLCQQFNIHYNFQYFAIRISI